MPVCGFFVSEGPQGATGLPLPCWKPQRAWGSSSQEQRLARGRERGLGSAPWRRAPWPYLARHHGPHVGQELGLGVSHHRHNGQLRGSRHEGWPGARPGLSLGSRPRGRAACAAAALTPPSSLLLSRQPASEEKMKPCRV